VHSFKAAGASGFLAAAVIRNGRYVGNITFGIEKGADGIWRVASQHLSPLPTPGFSAPVTAAQLINEMDDAGVERGVILSIAYWYGNPVNPFDNERERMRAENDWNVAQAAQFPDRLVVFCGVNPLKDYAIEELQRCRGLPQVRGMKIHFADSKINVRNPVHVEKITAFFRAADQAGMALVAHIGLQDPSYGADHTRILLEQILPHAPNIPIQLAHLAAGGLGCPPDAAVEVLANAIAAGDRRTRNLYFDVTHCVTLADNQPQEQLNQIASRLRQIGMDRILMGSDTTNSSNNPPINAWWGAFRRKIPLRDNEIRDIANNVPPYFDARPSTAPEGRAAARAPSPPAQN
jgi:predicted TIM-barrel fold metal-dependent hydrolase